MPPTDPKLLALYTNSKDESAFTELVTRHLPLVRGILHRGTGGKPELVDELSMQVFATLAQKAQSLQNRATIGGWLVITARNKAAEAMRSDAIRKKHMDRLADEPDTAAPPSELGESPHLDDALAELPEGDRQAVLLHYYDQLPYRVVGERLGKKEDATRKRVNKALETMGHFLRHRGVTLSATALASGLTENLSPTAHAATAATSATISKQALTLASSTHAPPAIGSIIAWLILATATCAISFEIAYATTRKSLFDPAEVAAPTGTSKDPLTAISKNKPANQVLSDTVAARLRDPIPARLQLAIDLWDERKTRATAYYEHSKVMESFRPEECAEAIDLMDRDYTYSPNRHWRMCDVLISTMLKDDPRATADYIMKRREAGDYFWKGNKRLWRITDIWGSADPAATREWLKTQNLSDKIRFQLLDGLIRSTSYKDPQGAIELLLELPPHLRNGSYGMLQSMDFPGLRDSMLQHTAQVADETERSHIFRRAILPDLEGTEQLEAAYAQMNFTGGDAVVPLIDAIIEKQTDNENEPAGYPAALDFAVEKLPEQAMPHLLDRHVRRWLKTEPDAAEKWLADHQLTLDDVSAATTSFRLR